MSQASGIAKLAQAEELANRQIADAKERRAQRIQEAKNSAAEQLAQQRAKYQADFDLQEAQSLGGTKEDVQKELQSQTDAHVSKMKEEFGANHGSVSDMLVKVVLDVQYSLHETLKKDSEFART
eukprot:INCI14610.1.p2 GENE.INCI14610.1~~INCI14610.1.p2  ORF type:complete len:124 (+),score=35.38 INCI14610.1:148-519(+)